MKCDYINLFIDDYIDHYLSEEQARIIELHTQQCASCARQLKDAQCQKSELENLVSPGLSTEFTERALLNTELYFEKNQTRAHKKSPYALGIAASILLACVILFSLPDNHTEHTYSTDKLAFNHQQDVNMVFNAPKDLHNVQFTIILPDNLEMLGHPGKRQVIWSGNLSAGPNLLSIPVLSNRSSSAVLTTKLLYENNSKTFKVKVNSPERQHVT